MRNAIDAADIGKSGSCHMLRNAHVGERRRHTLHSAAAWSCINEHDADLHACEHPKAGGRAYVNTSRKTACQDDGVIDVDQSE